MGVGFYCLLRGWVFGDLVSENTHLGKEKRGGHAPGDSPVSYPQALASWKRRGCYIKARACVAPSSRMEQSEGCHSLWVRAQLDLDVDKPSKLLFLALSSLLGLGWRGSWRLWLC